MNNESAVDAVITWVDGSEPAYRKKLLPYLQQQGITPSEGTKPTRFSNLGEIYYCIQSIITFAPWIRTIYIVTDGQKPTRLDMFKTDKIVIIDHQEIFSGFEEYLPTFNSLTIESMLWRIPNLAEKFIYFNDDFALIKPVKPEDFFRGSAMIVRGEWKKQSSHEWNHPWLKPAEPISAHRLVQEKSAQLVGNTKFYFRLPHVPYTLKKSVLEQFFTENPQRLLQNLRHRFRHPEQFWAVSVAQHLVLQQDAIIDKSLIEIMIHAGLHSEVKINKRLARADKWKDAAFICIQSIDEGTPILQNRLLNWLQQRLIPEMNQSAIFGRFDFCD